jgi:genome maintenance exonuclease 1
MTFNHVDHPPLPTLTRQQDASGKRWYVTPDGNKYPSVTTVLGYQEKPWLKDWRTMLGDKKADQEQKRTAERGTAVHELVEKYLRNDPYPDFTRGYKPEYIAGFNQLKLYLNKIDNIRTQEAYLYSDTLKLAGTVDCVAEYNNTLCIVDFKTSNNNKDKSMVQDYFLQCTAYAIMWHELTEEPIENITILMSVERGIVPLVFQDNIDKYVKPLLERTREFYEGQDK